MQSPRFRRTLAGALCLPLLGGLVAACGGSAKSSPPPPGTSGTTSGSGAYDPNGTLRIAFDLSAGLLSFDPAKATVSDSAALVGQVLDDSLLRQQPDDSLTPELATAASIVNPETVSVTLRPGVRFQDGDPLDAAAVKFTILRNSAANSVAFSSVIHDVSSVDLNGNLGVTIHLSKPDAGAFYPLLAGIETMPVSPAAIQRNDPNPVTNPLGAGAFRVKQYSAGQTLSLVKSPTYWNARSIKLGGIDFVEESGTGPAAINALKGGTVDVISSDISQLGALTGGGIQTSVASSPLSKLYFPLCATQGPLQNVQVRQALSYGLDRNAINQALAAGKGEPAWALVPKANHLFSSDLDNYYAYNPAKAKQLLAQAGYAKGLTLTVIPSPGAVNTSMTQIAQQEWKQIGVNLQIRSSTNTVQDFFINHLSNMGEANVVRSGLDAISFLFTPGHLGDACNYQNPTLTSMVDQLSALAPTDPKYVQLWGQAQDFIVKNALDVWAIWLPTVIAYNSNRVGGIQTVFPGVTPYPDFFTAYVKK